MKNKYPALEIIIALYKIITAIAFIVSFIVFGYISEEHGFLQGFIITTSVWIAIITVYSLAEVIRIFIRIEENTRK